MSTIDNDVPNDNTADDFDAVSAFEKLWDPEDAKKKQPSEDQEADDDVTTEEAPTEDQEAPEADTDEESSESTEDEGSEEAPEGDKKYVDDEKVYVKLTVDGKEVEASVKDLKRLYGQEAALTRKSQEVAQVRKAQDLQSAAQIALMQRIKAQAAKDYEPYSKLNFLALSKDPNITAEDLTSLQETAQAAWDRYQFINQDMDAYANSLRDQQHNELVEQAREAIKTLEDPEKGIKGWSKELYADIRTYATDSGLDPDIVGRIVDPAAIKLLHKAMLYDKGKAKVTTEPSAKRKVPKKIIKSSTTGSEVRDSTRTTAKTEMNTLRRTGRVDDAAAAFEARWKANSE